MVEVGERQPSETGGLMLDYEDAKALVRHGQEAGFLTHEEIALALDELDIDPVQVDEFYQALEELHIEVLDADAIDPEPEVAPEIRE
ncbi:MAG: hypothetical protein E6G67_08160, partial [Actinobacteria bacterium]